MSVNVSLVPAWNEGYVDTPGRGERCVCECTCALGVFVVFLCLVDCYLLLPSFISY